MNLMNARFRFNRPYEPPLATAEGPITLTEQARAFGEIRDWTEHGELDLEEALFHCQRGVKTSHQWANQTQPF